MVCEGDVCICKQQTSGNQRFDRQISAQEKGGDVRGVGQWIRTSNCLQGSSMILIGVHSGPHVTYTVCSA